MTDHIPGPWKYAQESIDPEWWIVTIQGGLIVANVNAHHRQIANARLIAAAPDLLDACASVWAALAGSNEPQLEQVANECRVAIAKATGTAHTPHNGGGTT